MNRIGRNEPCWCNSGKKFKHCHQNRHLSAPATRADALKQLKRAAHQVCLHPEAGSVACKGEIVKAHTIQRNGGLNRIAENGHVYGFKPSFSSLDKSAGKLTPTLIGIGKASIFTGFCQYHDTTLFRPLETCDFTGTPEQVLLLGYRSLCRELYMKEFSCAAVRFLSETDRGKDPKLQTVIQEIANEYQSSSVAGLRNLQYHKEGWDELVLSRDFATLKYYLILLEESPEIACSGAMCPDTDFGGQFVQSLVAEGKSVDIVTFSLIATGSGGAAVFAWLESSPCVEQLIRSLDSLDDSRIGNAIVQFAFESFENTFISPTWWATLPHPKQEDLIKRMNRGFPLLLLTELDPNRLIVDGADHVSWRIRERRRAY